MIERRAWYRNGSPSAPGQILVVVAAGMLVVIAMVGLVIDGGHAWGQQRRTQNSADGVAMAGTAIVQQWLADPSAGMDGGDVGCAVEAAATAHEIALERAEYTDHSGNLLDPAVHVPACGAAGQIPAGAQGVKATASEEFETFLMRAVGFPTLTASAEATAVVGTPAGVCPASEGCPVLPVTFPRTVDTCDGTSTRIIGESEWLILDEETPLDASNLSIVPLCKKGPGAVGWLDFGCGNLADHITSPCNQYIPIPAWLDTSPGNPNCCEGELRAYTGSQAGVAEEEDLVVQVPIHDFSCSTDLADPQPIENCPSYPSWSGNGDNFHYHIPYWVGFKLDGAFVQGSDRECNEAPGEPFAGGNGATGCLKGWFVSKVTAPGGVIIGPINPGDPVALSITLVR
jgi:hypothetical protein